jgi:hypothetical protein
MLAGVNLTLLLPLSWMAMPRQGPWSLRIAFGVAFLQGVANIGWLIGSTRMLFVNVVPHQRSTPYMAVYYAWIGVAGGLSQLAAGSLLDHSRWIDGRFLFFTFDPYTPLFAAGTILPLLSILLLREVRDEGRMSVGQFAGLFLRGNPFLALESSVRFYLARDERTTVSVTERLAQARSPINVDELLEALSDARFNVRFEAIVSIARVRSDPRLIEALSRVLQGSDPALGVVAAWALGRIGDPAGIAPLRRGLDSPYRSIQVHCARALGSLGDTPVAPLLLERLGRETEQGLCMAYASALGKFRMVDAIRPVLGLLRATEDTASRLELSLAVARIIGDEGPFIKLVRQARTGPGTAAAQVLAAVAKKFDDDRSDSERLRASAQGCGAAFARGNLGEGARLLQGLIEEVRRERAEPPAAQVLEECALRLAETGAARQEYVLLALFTLDQG